MNTSLDCMSCFMDMAVRMARLARPGEVDLHHRLVAAWGSMLADLDMSNPPPYLARVLWELIEEMTGRTDLYAEDKRECDERVMAMLPGLRAKLGELRTMGGDSLALALEVAIVGNFIDRGVPLDYDWEAALNEVAGDVPEEVLARFHAAAKAGAEVLILGDNAGEIAADTLLVEELNRRGCRVTYAVRERPILNDATLENAQRVGMDKLCRVVSSGSTAPGTVLDLCFPEFLDTMRGADVILSKGQGNFEALNDRWPGVFFAFKAKCPRVATELGAGLGETMFLRNGHDIPEGGAC